MKAPSIPISNLKLFESKLRDQVRSTAPLCSWVATMRRRGLVSTVQADDLSLRSTSPILDLVFSGELPGGFGAAPSGSCVVDSAVNKDCGAESGRSRPGGLGPDHVVARATSTGQRIVRGVAVPAPNYRDYTAGVAEFGPFSTSTRDR